MAALIKSPAVTLIAAITLLAPLTLLADGYRGRKVGCRTEITDVKLNKEVQELGRFCVEEYNKRLRLSRESSEDRVELKFTEVVEAQSQVVSGIKYYLKISAADRNGVPKMFDSVVVVKPWLQSKQLLNFEPSFSTTR